jgi:hypothetical protein
VRISVISSCLARRHSQSNRYRGANTYMSPASSSNKKAVDVEETTADVSDNGCVHHWVIDPPNGAVSEGRCKACGEKKEFRNSFEYSSWYGNKSPAPKAGAKGAEAAKGAADPKASAAPAKGAAKPAKE